MKNEQLYIHDKGGSIKQLLWKSKTPSKQIDYCLIFILTAICSSILYLYRQFELLPTEYGKVVRFKIKDIYLRTLDSSVSNSIRKRIPTETRVWYTALAYFESGMTNSDGLALVQIGFC